MSKINIKPLHDRIIVKRLEGEEKTKGGIIIPETAKEKPQRGEVVATGKGRVNDSGKLQALEVKPGDEILFGKYAGTEFKVSGEEYLMMKEDEVFGILKLTTKWR